MGLEIVTYASFGDSGSHIWSAQPLSDRVPGNLTMGLKISDWGQAHFLSDNNMPHRHFLN